MKKSQTLIIILLFFSINTFGQSDKKMEKNLTVTINGNYDKTKSIYFKPKFSDKKGFEKISSEFEKSFISKSLLVSSQPDYTFIMEYKYVYVISRYSFQYSELAVNVMDKDNNIVATIFYRGKFDVEDISEAIAERFK